MFKKAFFFYFSFFLCLFLFFQKSNVWAQNREGVNNNIGWLMYVGDHKIAKKWSLHTEYQWRRNDFGRVWQQSLLRVGVNYVLSDVATLTFGYGYIETFAYGEMPISRLNKQGSEQSFPEHRLYQDLVLKNNTGRFEVAHRLRLEQRWLGNFYDANDDRLPNQWRLVNRFRYRFRAALPLKGKTITDKSFYLHGYNEIFIGFGENITSNIFDQNRINIGLGYKINAKTKVEGGFFNQMVQKPRLAASGKAVIEYNNGFLVMWVYNFN